MKTMTYQEALSLADISIPDHLEAEAEVPVLTVVQRQGDLLIVPAIMPKYREDEGRIIRNLQKVGPDGVQVVYGEATGNTHWLHNNFDSQVHWLPAERRQAPIRGWVIVPDGQSALLIHTDEHGANAMGPGTYEIRQRRQVTSAGNWAYTAD